MTKPNSQKSNIVLGLAIAVVALGALISSGLFGLNWKFLENLAKFPVKTTKSSVQSNERVKVVTEESVVIDVVDKVSPSVVTIGVTKSKRTGDIFEIDPFNPFSPFMTPRRGTPQKVEQDIGSGFIVGADGLIVTNKHVVSDASATYKVITKDDKSYDVVKIYRDPVNDMAILKIDASSLPVVSMGDSSQLKAGQMAIAIGTALGEFRNTVTTGVISGIGRGITAGSPFAGEAERLDNVIQTDAAINPGNSGGPLLNSSGQVIGVNTAVSSEGQNIGFALPINVVKEAITNFNQTGQFDRPYLGVRYKVVTRDVAILNDIPEGAYVIEVVESSPADQAGLMPEDIITKINDTRLSGANAELSKAISTKKVGDRIQLTVYRDTKEMTLTATLGNQSEQ